ncbi:hypothetical protein FHL15_000915 [Xylaria flabelliformis]|uniref:DUF7735 domain-containing protein n=1 Tax=Xylaria flabelliformis TaxID=2512241 RepID=A0A553IDK0_9PEZI|nr:hypothetical protein FHL15_000915 [Xylaria flabelliformis]
MMYNSKALLSAALLTGASVAQTSSESSDAQCTQSYVSLLAGAPTPDGQLASAITSYASGIVQSATAATDVNPLAYATQVCDFSSSLPSSLQSDFDAYVTQVISYVSASSSAIDAVITNCVATGAEGAAYTSLVNSFAAHTGPLCAAATGTTTGLATGTGIPSGTANSTTTFVTGTPTPSSTGVNGGGASSSVPTGAAAMPTAVLGGAAAAAGLLGVIALL